VYFLGNVVYYGGKVKPIRVNQHIKRVTQMEAAVETKNVKCIGHGGYGAFTRYNVTQHGYAASQCSFIECLAIEDPPEGYAKFIVYLYSNYGGSCFAEWETLEDAKYACKNFWPAETVEQSFPKLKGFKRFVSCGMLTPWFYAVGNQKLIGDYALPEKLQDDPYYTLGRKFVFCEGGLPIIKTCIGTYLLKERGGNFGEEEYTERIVFFDDGKSYTVRRDSFEGRPLDDKESWVVEATRQFQQFLSGRTREFSIKLADGNTLVGKLVESASHHDVEGTYDLFVTFKSGDTREGEFDFVPSKADPTVFAAVERMLSKKLGPIESVKVRKCEPTRGGKKWGGLFYF